MEHYTTDPEQHNNIVTDDSESAADRYALHLSRRIGFPVTIVLAALIANAAVKEH